MTIEELRQALIGLPADWIVVMSKDGEGNGFSPLAEIDHQQMYTPDSTWSGDVDDTGDESCVVLWPTN